MAKNSLGELENAPGAARRERAHYAAELAEARTALASAQLTVANQAAGNARNLSLKGYLGGAFGKGELTHSPAEYYDASRKETDRANELFKEAAEHNASATELQRAARRDRFMARIETVAAKFGLRLK